MLSVLIPVYNYAVFPLVLEVHKQCIATGIQFEILCQDDSSTSQIEENLAIEQLPYCTFSQNKVNLGRGNNLNLLIQKAQFDWLLLLDCDTFPRDSFFIKNYLSLIQKPMSSLVFGGIIYHPKRPHASQLLRWVYGKKREALPCNIRNKKPNSSALTSNLLIKKEIATQFPFPESLKEYGYEDFCFLTNLASHNITVFHLDNPTFHLNLETSTAFLAKTEMAQKNLLFLVRHQIIDTKESKIARVFLLVEKLKLVELLSWLFQKTKKKVSQNLCSKKPSLFLFDWYKLGYLCYLQTNAV
ncbi:MAG: glycosyltransferase [Flavobacterium sp.]|nr:MAG: glycosyltransferase [Flavobacterium sp.]